MSFHPLPAGRRPLVFGHRGGSALAPENTSAAFDRGLEAGADGLELDVRLSRDGQAVACHDATLDRTTDATGPVSAYSARELRGVDAGYRFPGPGGTWPFRGRGLGLPLLRDVLARYPRRPLIVELKEDEPELAREVLRLVREADAVDGVCLGSFHSGVLAEARRLEPRIATGASAREVRVALYGSWVGWIPRGPYRALQVPEQRGALRVASRRMIRAAHRAGVAVQVWVVDEADRIRRLAAWGADGIITDRPDVGSAVVRE